MKGDMPCRTAQVGADDEIRCTTTSGGFLYRRDSDQSEWSAAVARMHGYERGAIMLLTRVTADLHIPDAYERPSTTSCWVTDNSV